MEEGLGEAVMEVGEGSVAVNYDDAGISADVAEGLVMGAGDYVSSIAAHESQLLRQWRRVGVPGVSVAGAGGGIEGVRVNRRRGGSGCDWGSGGERWLWGWGLHRRRRVVTKGGAHSEIVKGGIVVGLSPLFILLACSSCFPIYLIEFLFFFLFW